MSANCTCDGKRESPSVAWNDAPEGTKSFAISLWHTAPDQEKSYWVVYNIPANVTKLAKNDKSAGTVGLNDKNRPGFWISLRGGSSGTLDVLATGNCSINWNNDADEVAWY